MLPHLAIEERNADETTRGYEPKVSNGLESLSGIGVEEWTTLKLARCSTTMLNCFATFCASSKRLGSWPSYAARRWSRIE